VKKTLLLSIFLCIVSSSAWSLTIQSGAIDVGGVDNLIASAKVNSGDANELAWVKSALNTNDIFLDAKYDTISSNWSLTNQANTYAIDFSTYNPKYFLIKLGIGSLGNIPDHYLFENTPELGWGVVNIADLGITSIIGVGRISHVDEFNGTAPVPEPTTLILLGTGLLGLAGLRRKIKK